MTVARKKGQPRAMDNVKKELEELFMQIDIKPLLRKVFFDGFDNYADYEKYGDMFVKLRINEEPLDRPESDQRLYSQVEQKSIGFRRS